MGGNVQFMKMIFFQHVCVANKKKQGCAFLAFLNALYLSFNLSIFSRTVFYDFTHLLSTK